MPSPQEARPRARSALGAAFLSLIFPGLGHAYAGAYARALAFAAPPILFVALVGGIALRMDRGQLFGLLLANLGPILLLDLLILVYRAAAIVDAWRVTTYLNAWDASGGGRLGRPRLVLAPVSLAGLLAVLLVMAGAHAVVARYDLTAMGLVNCVFDSSGTASCDDTGAPGASPGTGAVATPTDVLPSANGSIGTALPTQATAPPWNGTDRLNILLIGTDQRPAQGTFNTDTLIVVSIDPATRQVALFTLPRDAVGVPVPPGPSQSVWGSTYQGKINSWYMQNVNRADLWPGTDRQRGFNALKAILGNLYQLDIKYYVEVNFDGFRSVVDSLGGVTINVQNPVVDDQYPGDNGRLLRLYIPTGPQHMSGEQALEYARSRHASDDFNRGQRQQRVLLSLREQTNVAQILPNLDSLVAALKTAVHTDIPVGILPNLLGLAEGVDTHSIHSYVFAPPLYGSQGYVNGIYQLQINPSRIRSAVAAAFRTDPNAEVQREALSQEAARVWVLNGSGQQGQASNIAAFLTYQGVQASAPNQRPPGSGGATRIVVYNGAEARLPITVAYLQKLFGVKVTTAVDPTARVDIAITTAASTPNLTPPPAP